MLENNYLISETRNNTKQLSLNLLPAKSSVNVQIQKQNSESSKQKSSNPNLVLQKFSNYLKFHDSDPEDIWGDKVKLNYLFFVREVQKKLGYTFNVQEIMCLKQVADNDQLRIDHLNNAGIWVKNNQSRLIYISQKHLRHRASKHDKSSVKILMFHNKRSSVDREPTQKQHTFYRKGTNNMKTTCDRLTKTFLKSGFAVSQNRNNKIEALREDLQMNSLEKKWKFIVMAGQMNKWIDDSISDFNKQNKIFPSHYKIVNSKEGFIIVRVSQSGEQETIPEVVFFKKYNSMKKKKLYTNEIQPKVTLNPLLGDILQMTVKPQCKKLSQRDKELNQAVLHIMRVKNILQYQHKILSQSAVNT